MFVGNLDFQTSDGDLLDAFAPFGAVANARVMTNPVTGETHGYGFVQMDDDSEARAALKALEGTPLRGRALMLFEKQDKKAS